MVVVHAHHQQRVLREVFSPPGPLGNHLVDVLQPGAVTTAIVGDEVGLLRDRLAVEDVGEDVVRIHEVPPVRGAAGEHVHPAIDVRLLLPDDVCAMVAFPEEQRGQLDEHRGVRADHAVVQRVVAGDRSFIRPGAIEPTEVLEETHHLRHALALGGRG